jgi:GGDEF-like domain
MPMTDSERLSGHYADVLRMNGGDQRRRAYELGARAADAALNAQDLITVVLSTASTLWAGAPVTDDETPGMVHLRATSLLKRLQTTMGGALDGFYKSTRAALSQSDVDRADFVNDLLTGRSDPGDLAHRANRYGIRIAGAHTVIVARAGGLTEAVVRTIDERLAERFGAGNTSPPCVIRNSSASAPEGCGAYPRSSPIT